MVSKRLRHLVSWFTPVTKRIATIRIGAKFYNVSLICAHAPMEEKDDGVKNTFYAKLEDVYDKCSAHDTKIVLGDFKAKVGREDIFGPTVVQFSLHANTTSNGMRLIDLDIHKATWMSPDKSTLNQIDHIVIDGWHVSIVLDVRTFRGPNQDLIAAKFRLRIIASRSARSSALRKLEGYKRQLRRSPLNSQGTSVVYLSDIGELWANISHYCRNSP